jgi:hypothetical protein
VQATGNTLRYGIEGTATSAAAGALNSIATAYPGGITLTDDRVKDIATCDSLVETGHVLKIVSDDIDGVGYQLSEEMAEAANN